MSPFSDSLLPATGDALRLRICPEPIFDAAAGVPRLYIHARNPGAELAGIQSLGTPFLDEDVRLALFPECGLNVSLDHLAAIHAVLIDKLIRPAPGVEFDFQHQPNGLSMVALDPSPETGKFTEVLHSLRENVISASALLDWRAHLDPTDCVCGNCRAAAELRTATAHSHPLTKILENAVERRLPLLCRIQSPHLGFVREFIPGHVKIREGKLDAIGADGSSLLQIKLAYTHSLWVLPIRIDGDPWCAIRVYDMLGQLNLEIAAAAPALEPVWRAFCEAPESPFC